MARIKKQTATSVLSDASNVVLKKLHSVLLKLNGVLEDSIKKTTPPSEVRSSAKKRKFPKSAKAKRKVSKARKASRAKKTAAKKTKAKSTKK